jgi:diguanylate cyclase (GGDEF)-like protein
MRVLYVEDHIHDADLLYKKLSRDSPQISLTAAGTLLEARTRLASDEAYDAAIIDLRLPDGNGLELLTEIRENALPLPVIVLTGSGDEAAAVSAFRAGADDYIVKRGEYLDLLPKTLESAISRFCAERARRERPIRVLYVEHNMADIDLTKYHLARYAPHIQLEAVYSPEAALAALHPIDGHPEKYDILLLDFCLPGFSALDMLKELLQQYKSALPVVLVTGHGDEESAVRALRLGAFDYLVKRKDYLLQLPSVLESAYYHAELVREQAALRESEMLKSSIIDTIPDTLVRFTRQGRIVDLLNNEQTRLLQKKDRFFSSNVPEVLPQDFASSKLLYCIEETLRTGELQTMEYDLETAAGMQDFEARFMICGRDEVVAFIRDITERKRNEEQLKYFCLYDQLTAIYNRAFFEEELKRQSCGREYPIAVISADLDGLKLINDTLGHEKGDEILRTCAFILKQSLRGSDVLARIGGDEFAAILPRTDQRAADEALSRIKENIEQYNSDHPEFPLSISIGLAVAENPETTLKETLRHAGDFMYSNKLLQSSSARSQILKALMSALAERDYLTEGHAQRLADLSLKIGELAGISAVQLSNLALLAQVHDLGKVGIPDHILNKAGKLNEDEWMVMRQHPEKGYRIAMSSPSLAPVAELILKHHERWDGSGYPLGIAGEEIPVECRILAVVDAFDAMTNDRPYSKAVNREEALEEIKRCKGSQFDPQITELFLSLF